MNIYLIVEGPVGEKRVYSHWISLINPNLKIVNSLDDVIQNNLIIFSGGGYPQYFDLIVSGVEDVASNKNIDRLVIAVDSEDMTYDEKWQEINDFVLSLGVKVEYKIVVQHFCLETWALGNDKIIDRSPKNTKLQEYKNFFNILENDPELLPEYKLEGLNRSQFAERYLRKLLNEKFKNLTYTKSNPSVLLNDKYFHRVKNRFEKTGHIKSFNNFLLAFI